LTLKIKLGGKAITSAAVESDAEVSSVGESGLADSSLGGVEEGLWPPSDPSITEETVEQELEAMASDGEEAWLVAMEKGQLDETGYLPQRAGTSLTARQRAMLGSADGQLMELPVGKAVKEMTEEMVLKKTEKNRKRRVAAQRRKERRKAETVRRLLEKQSKKKEEAKLSVGEKPAMAYLHYVSSQHSTTLSIPHGVDFPLTSQPAKLLHRGQQLCAVEGCSCPRRYRDSTTLLPLCSLECYKTLHQQLTPLDPLLTQSTINPFTPT
jgi:INO80 complex subunit B